MLTEYSVVFWVKRSKTHALRGLVSTHLRAPDYDSAARAALARFGLTRQDVREACVSWGELVPADGFRGARAIVKQARLVW